MPPLRLLFFNVLGTFLVLLDAARAYPSTQRSMASCHIEMCRTPTSRDGLRMDSPDQKRLASCVVEKYSTPWFLQNTKWDYRHELVDNAIFYTRDASKAAQKMACKSRNTGKVYVTIWDIWPLEFYDPDGLPDKDASMTNKTYFENMSRAYARMARNTAVVMHMTADYKNPPKTGIWYQVEQPMLRDCTNVIQLWKINEDRAYNVSMSLMPKIAESYYSAMRVLEEFWAKTMSKSSTAQPAAGSCLLYKDNALDRLM